MNHINGQTYTKGRTHHSSPDHWPDSEEFLIQSAWENGYYRRT